MKITRFHQPSLRNDEFFQFMTRVREMVMEFTPATLKIEAVYNEFDALYAELDEAVKKISKSAHTAEITKLDHARDTIFNGMAGQVRSDLNHYDPVKIAAAERLIIVFDTYGNLAQRAHDEETAGIYNLLKELTEKHAADVNTLALEGWITELDKRNRAVEAIMMERFDEGTARTSLVVRRVRLAIGDVYYRMADRIDALQIVEGDNVPEVEPDVPGKLRTVEGATVVVGSPWAAFIVKLNEIIDHTLQIVAVRKGKAAAQKEKEKEKEEEAKAKEAKAKEEKAKEDLA